MPSYTCSPAGCDEKCKTETPSSTASTSTSPDNRGINMAGCMTGIGCSLDVSELLGLKKNVTNKEDRTSVLTFVQDIILAATFFIGTVVTIAFIYAGFKLIYSS
ncbi:MAG: hypothetical protein LBH96_02605 [Candidatus Peribacteria bacterium]|jgi:hypothetical protein|nr:hypothetical protein [Candidatus Peribacteria bacterium]